MEESLWREIQQDGFANILSLNNVKKMYDVTYYSTAYDCFEVHKVNGTKHVFKPSKKVYSTQV